MGRMLGTLQDRRFKRLCFLTIGTAIGLVAPTMATGQIRGKLPDRGVYQPPTVRDSVAQEAQSGPGTLDSTTESELGDLLRQPNASGIAKLPNRAPNRPSTAIDRTDNGSRPLMDIGLDVPANTVGGPQAANRSLTPSRPTANTNQPEATVVPVSHQDVMPPTPSIEAGAFELASAPVPMRTMTATAEEIIENPTAAHDATCDGCDQCALPSCDSPGIGSLGCGVDGCDACDGGFGTMGCDSMGCDAGTAHHRPWHHRWSNASLSLRRDRWFGSIEYLMMWRRGDRLPALVTTDTSATPNADTAGELGRANTVVLVGQDRVMQRMGSGGRATIGTWLDDCESLSLVGRGWYGGQKSYDFQQDQTQSRVLTRPFFNVSDGQTAAQDTQIVAFPNRASGVIRVEADSEAFGGDVSIRQFLCGDLGVNFDLLYGYQFMRLNESLGIASTSTSLSDDFAPVGAVLSVADQFRVSNEFHGGQIGLATSYREPCWSFNALTKLGFGSLSRDAERSGTTITRVDNATTVDNQGLLVRDTNSGSVSDGTFAWVPELDLSLGWHRFANWDLTFGYHLIALSETLQPSGAIDPDLAVNLSDPPTGQQRPFDGLRYRTFYLHGIHFGVQHVY